MKLEKLVTGVAVAGVTLAVSSAALAVDPPLTCSDEGTVDARRAALVQEIQRIARELRCANYPEVVDAYHIDDGNWYKLPLWQFKRNENGCEVHEKLARQLYEQRSDDPSSKPPRNKWDSNDAAGAANDVENHKYDDAIIKLTAFHDTIVYSYADKYNKDYDKHYSPGAAVVAGEFAAHASVAIGCITDLIAAE